MVDDPTPAADADDDTEASTDLKPDAVALELAPAGVPKVAAVTFRGWLSANADGSPLSTGIYRVFRSPWLDEWFDIKKDDLLYREQLADGSSSVWVRHDARILKCQDAEARHFADEEMELGSDPTAANPLAAKVPRYG
jgi:hypothetical protein